jgi:hypothetical protein
LFIKVGKFVAIQVILSEVSLFLTTKKSHYSWWQNKKTSTYANNLFCLFIYIFLNVGIGWMYWLCYAYVNLFINYVYCLYLYTGILIILPCWYIIVNVVSSTPRLIGIRTHNISGDRHLIAEVIVPPKDNMTIVFKWQFYVILNIMFYISMTNKTNISIRLLQKKYWGILSRAANISSKITKFFCLTIFFFFFSLFFLLLKNNEKLYMY